MNTWMHNEETALEECLQRLQISDLLLAHQVKHLHNYRVCVNVNHHKIIVQMEDSNAWRGPRGIGVRKGAMVVDIPSSLPLPTGMASQAGTGNTAEEEGVVERADSGDEYSDDVGQHGCGAMYVLWNALGDGRQTVMPFGED